MPKFEDAKKSEPIQRTMWAPYLFKVPAYQYEQEIRFVFGTHPNLVPPATMFAAATKGALVTLDAKTLIQDEPSGLFPDLD
jgi:hypothetical protein